MAENGATQFGQMPDGTEYLCPSRVVVFYDGGKESEHSFSKRESKNGSHVFYVIGKDNRDDNGGFQLNLNVTKIASGDAVKLEAARKARQNAKESAMKAENERLQAELDALKAK